jgi:hypothetical protein
VLEQAGVYPFDVKFLERIAGSRRRLYQFTAIDDCNAHPRAQDLRCLQPKVSYQLRGRGHPTPSLQSARDTDGQWRRVPVKLHWHLEERDIRHVYIRPRTPSLNGKVERSHRVDEQEFYQLLDKDGIADDIRLFNDKLREWEDYYNYHRPHGALDGQTPYERLLAKKSSASVSPKS